MYQAQSSLPMNFIFDFLFECPLLPPSGADSASRVDCWVVFIDTVCKWAGAGIELGSGAVGGRDEDDAGDESSQSLRRAGKGQGRGREGGKSRAWRASGADGRLDLAGSQTCI